MTTVNVDRLRDVLEHVTTCPHTWDQNVWLVPPEDAAVEAQPGTDWTCGTTACLAGWAALRHGYRPSRNDDHVVRLDDPDDWGYARFVSDVARELLGLTREQGDLLFAGANALRDLWEYARVFTDGAIEVPDEVRRTSLIVTFDEDEARATFDRQDDR